MIYYEKYGDESNPVIILLHGSNFVHCFSNQYDYLSKKYCVMLPHIPGFGKSSEMTYSTRLAEEKIVEFAENLGRKSTLVGFSLGAQLCMPLICRHGELFDGAVMISPWLIKETADIEKAMKQQSDNEKMARSDIFIDINGLAAGLNKAERQEHKEFCKSVSMKSLLASIDNGITIEAYPEFAGIDKPMMAIAGMKELTDVRKSVHDLARLNPHCSYDIWDGAAHNIPFKQASKLNKTIEHFIEKNILGL